ncbi:MAG TPA: single-stranded-DNA-specific exonuclease RecJ [Gammaproteobacteria bacterium]|nr:single-stranded-DNA-specific exonuclease RecJ [Gammaproteobacteria bacterium]
MSHRRIEQRQLRADTELPDTLHPLLRRIYAGRDIRDANDLSQTLAALHDFRGFSGLDAAIELVADCLQRQRRILLIGDFDCDGATSTALAVRALRRFGAQQVYYLVPNRFEFGYGLTPGIVALAARRTPHLIITVDNGISSVEGVAAARDAGIRVLVTDHHLPGAQLPAADAILNPNLPGDAFPSKALAGVGVVFYLLLALRAHLRERRWFETQGIAEPNLAEFLDIVALGTVADLVPLDHNNRVLVAQGLARLRAGRGVPGIHALLQCGGREAARLVASDLAFAVAPRLNAAGRLTDMSLGIECLLTDDPLRARELAARLDELNRERRNIESQMQEEALRNLADRGFDQEDPDLPFGLCLFDAHWHQGVVGLVAARIKDRVHRPVIAFARADDGLLKGSARSIRGLHIRDTLEAVSTRHPGLIGKFGGHAMAAGLSLAEEQYQPFCTAFDAEVRRRVSARDLTGVIQTDGELAPDWFTLECAALLRDAGPWGQGFPEPCFNGCFTLLERRVLAGAHLKMALAGPTGQRLDAIAFRETGEHIPDDCRRVRIVYRPDINTYRDVQQLQLLVDHVEPA